MEVTSARPLDAFSARVSLFLREMEVDRFSLSRLIFTARTGRRRSVFPSKPGEKAGVKDSPVARAPLDLLSTAPVCAQRLGRAQGGLKSAAAAPLAVWWLERPPGEAASARRPAADVPPATPGHRR